MNIKKSLVASALTICLTAGGATAAFATGDGEPTTPSPERIEQLCANKGTIIEHLTTRQSNLNKRIAKWTTLQQKASDAGRTNVAERIAHRITRLNEELAKVTQRLANAPALIEEYCS